MWIVRVGQVDRRSKFVGWIDFKVSDFYARLHMANCFYQVHLEARIIPRMIHIFALPPFRFQLFEIMLMRVTDDPTSRRHLS